MQVEIESKYYFYNVEMYLDMYVEPPYSSSTAGRKHTSISQTTRLIMKRKPLLELVQASLGPCGTFLRGCSSLHTGTIPQYNNMRVTHFSTVTVLE